MPNESCYENELGECEEDVRLYAAIARRIVSRKRADPAKTRRAEELLQTAINARNQCKARLEIAKKKTRK